MATPAEQIFLRTHPSRLYSFPLYTGGVLLLVVAIGLAVNSFLGLFAVPAVALGPVSVEAWLITAVTLLGIVLLLAAEVRRLATTYTITDFRVVRRRGIVNITTDAVPYRQVERVELSQSLLQRLVKVGTVAIDTGEELLLIEHVSKPDSVERIISQRIATFR